MSEKDNTFSRAISYARKEKGWSLKDLSSRIRREDGQPISPQYLNDIEHDRRRPSSDHIVQQFADALEVDRDWLYYLAGRFPEDVRRRQFSEQEVKQRMVVFRNSSFTRRSLHKGRGQS